MDTRFVLLTLDGSKLSEAAIPYAAALARATDKPLRLLSVLTSEFDGVFPRRAAMPCAALAQTAHAFLEDAATQLRGQGCEVETEVVTGVPAAEIVRASGRPDVAGLVMATHGHGGLTRWALGSVADKVMRLAECPTLVVPSLSATGRVPGVRRIVVPLDGSALSESALPIAAELASAKPSKLFLVTVVPLLTSVLNWGDAYVPELAAIENEAADNAKAALQVLRAQLPESMNVATEVLRGHPGLALAEHAERANVDLFVMASHGLGGLSRAVMGSTASQLVHARIPVLLVHPQNRDAGAVLSGDSPTYGSCQRPSLQSTATAAGGSRRVEEGRTQ